MMKISYIGAGSAVFARQLMTDILSIEGLDEGTFALIDIDAERLDLARRIGQRLVERSGKAWQIQASTDRAEVLAGSDVVINSIEVAAEATVGLDYEIPLRYGVDQCIGDTIGPGGIFKALRTGPVWLAIMADVARLCPDALVLNYTNPMSVLTLAAARVADLPVVGLCHSVQSTSRRLAEYLGIPYSQLTWQCAGINHNAWFTLLRRGQEDLYPRLHQLARQPEIYERDPVRFETMLHLGAFVTESSGHFSEYVPYFRSRPELVRRYSRAGFGGESGFRSRNYPRRLREHRRAAEAWADGIEALPEGRSHEYASDIVEGLALDRTAIIYGNVVNDHLIDNLPAGGCAEVACVVDRRGVQPVHFGNLPEQLAALNRAHMAVHELMVESLLHRDRRSALYALMLDPLTAAVCSLDEIERMFEEMWEAERPYLGAFEDSRRD
ncbi:MAG: alpha-galactosidase [Candidatus Dormibacteraeota bacterium]|nr:alpha-galactosidase [Candidatus Dormibacteraeota bacterium]